MVKVYTVVLTENKLKDILKMIILLEEFDYFFIMFYILFFCKLTITKKKYFCLSKDKKYIVYTIL